MLLLFDESPKIPGRAPQYVFCEIYEIQGTLIYIREFGAFGAKFPSDPYTQTLDHLNFWFSNKRRRREISIIINCVQKLVRQCSLFCIQFCAQSEFENVVGCVVKRRTRRVQRI